MRVLVRRDVPPKLEVGECAPKMEEEELAGSREGIEDPSSVFPFCQSRLFELKVAISGVFEVCGGREEGAKGGGRGPFDVGK